MAAIVEICISGHWGRDDTMRKGCVCVCVRVHMCAGVCVCVHMCILVC